VAMLGFANLDPSYPNLQHLFLLSVALCVQNFVANGYSKKTKQKPTYALASIYAHTRKWKSYSKLICSICLRCL